MGIEQDRAERGTEVLDDLEVDLLSEAFFQDPYPIYARLREEAPVYWCVRDAQWLVSRYEDVVTVLQDWRRFSSVGFEARYVDRLPAELRAEIPTAVRRAHGRNLQVSDPPEHRGLRRRANKAFTQAAVQNLEPRVKDLVDAILDTIVGKGRCDVIEDLAFPLPATVVVEIMGVPSTDRDRIKAWATDVIAFNNQGRPTPELARRYERALAGFYAYLRELFADRRAKPQDDLISGFLADPPDADDAFDEETLLSTSILFLTAGHETTTSLIGNTVYLLLTHPDQLTLVSRDPSLVPAVLEESLRYESPIQRFRRIAVEDVELGGQRIRAGDVVMALLGAANRDPRRFENPDVFDPRRGDDDHVAFGRGIHFCIGAGLARLEAATALRALVQRLHDPQLGHGWTPTWVENPLLRGLTALPITFTPR